MTAVEWLYKNLLDNPISNEDVEYNEAVFHNAKEMEKQQISKAYFSGWDEELDRSGEEYYNEKFNK
jgi:hypothetical protein